MKKQQDIVIDAFEARIMQLLTITNITKLPQWADADVIGAECLLKAYRKVETAISIADNKINTVLAKIVIDSAVALNLNPIHILHDFCKIISDVAIALNISNFLMVYIKQYSNSETRSLFS